MKNILKEHHEDKIFGSRVERMRMVDDSDVVNKDVLDVGCGFGWCAWNFLQRGVKKFVGIDVTADSEKAFNKFKDKRISFKLASALDLPFKDKSFDTVVSWETLEHVPRNTEGQMFAEIYRILKPGGVLYLSTQHRSFISTVLDPAWWLIGHRHYKVSRVKELAEQAGFSVNKIYTKGGIYTVTFMLNLYFTKWVLRRRPFYENEYKQKCTEEFEKDAGYTNIFLKCTKSQ